MVHPTERDGSRQRGEVITPFDSARGALVLVVSAVAVGTFAGIAFGSCDGELNRREEPMIDDGSGQSDG